MRHKMKKIIILSIIFMLFSCSEDFYEDALQQKNEITIKDISLKDLSKSDNPNLFKTVQKIKAKKESVAGKMVYDSINRIYFDDENGKLIETATGYKSYTFKVERETPNNFELENIVFSKKGSEYEAILVKYELTPSEVEKLKNNILFNPTVDPSIEILQKNIACNTIIDHCRIMISPSTGEIIGYEITYLDPCEGSGGGSNTGTGTGSGNNSGSSSSNGNSGTGGLDPIPSGTGTSWEGGGSNTSGGLLTTPTGGGTSAVANPCKKFKMQNDDFPSLRQALTDLEATKNQDHENGIFIESNNSNVQNAITSTSASSTVNFPNLAPPNKYKIMAHTHDAHGPNGTGTFSIFSWVDLLELADIIKEEELDDTIFTYYLATADNTRYALTIYWPSAYYEYFDIKTNPNDPSQTNYFNSEKYIEIMDKIEKKYYSETPIPGKISYTSNPEDDLKIFLKMIKELKLSASLFEVDPTYSTFTKLSLNSNGTVKRGTPCN